MKTTRTSTEVRTFKVEQECGFIHCNGTFKSLDLFNKEKQTYLHECSDCGELQLFEKEHPYLEYEEVEKIKTEKEIDLDAFDDDIPF